jgi:cardiolipin synthase (CMP-forming)
VKTSHYHWFGMLTDLPNVLTLSRIAAIPLLVALIAINTPAGDLAACITFAAAAITDYFDGKLARSRRQQSDLGRMLDPIADKLLVGAALMMLVGQNRLSALGLYPAIVIMLREILVSGLREYLAGIRVGLPVTRLAKWKTGFQMGALGTLLAGNFTFKLFAYVAHWRNNAVVLGGTHVDHRLGLPDRRMASCSGSRDTSSIRCRMKVLSIASLHFGLWGRR